MDYENDIKIDESALDVEWLEQPRLMLKYAKYMAVARKEMDHAKEALEFVKADLDADIRKAPEEFGIEKISNPAVEAAILRDDGYIKAMKDYIKAKFEYEIAQGAVRAFDQRKAALENLVRLHGQQYFAGPKVPRNISEEWERKEASRKSSGRIGRQIKQRTKDNHEKTQDDE